MLTHPYKTILSFMLIVSLAGCKKEKKDQGPDIMPTITDVRSSSLQSPKDVLGKPNDQVFITGHNFSSDPAQSSVLFNGQRVTASAGDSTYMFVRVPDEISPGSVKLTVITRGKTIVLPNSFIITAPVPTLSILATNAAMRGAKVVLTAQDLSITPGKTTININGTPVIIDSIAPNVVYFTIPANATDGKLIVNTRGNTLLYPQEFKIINSTFSKISNASVENLTRDAAGNLYGTIGNTVVKTTATGIRSTIATIGVSGSQMTHLGGCVADPAGNLYISSPANFSVDYRSSFTTDNSKIYKISSGGGISVFAGSTRGNGDGQGVNAQFTYPEYLAINKKTGDLYVADGTVIRKITATGLVSTLAGSSIASDVSVDGQGAAARFNSIRGMTVDDRSSDLYIIDGSAAKVRKISPGGLVSTLNITGPCCILPAGKSLSSVGLATMDAGGNLWMASESIITFDRSLFKFKNGEFINTYLNPSMGMIKGLTADEAGNLYLSTVNDNVYVGTVSGIYKITP